MIDKRELGDTNGQPGGLGIGALAGAGEAAAANQKPAKPKYCLRIRRAIAMDAAKCDVCGITAGGHPGLFQRTRIAGNTLYMKCLSCETNFQIVVMMTDEEVARAADKAKDKAKGKGGRNGG